MKKYINLDNKYESSYETKLHRIKDAGFDGVFLHSKHEPQKYINCIIHLGLEIETLHLPYKKYKNGILIDSRYVNAIWTGGTLAEEYIRELFGEIDFANQFNIPTVVMHITGGDNPPKTNANSLTYIEMVLSHCEKYGITLCLENLRRLDYLQYVFDNLSSPNLKFCFDSGHANVMTHNVATFPWDVFGSKLSCLHLNDNHGSKDEHLPPLYGNILWEPLIKKITKFKADVNFTLEVRSSEIQRQTMLEEEYLALCINSLYSLEKLKEI